MVGLLNPMKRLIVVVVSLLTIVGVLYKLSKTSAPDLQEVLKQIPNENMLGLSSNRENQLADRLEQIADRLVKQQDERISQLEADRKVLEKKIQELRRPPADSTLREKLAFLFPYDQSKKFPAYIWQSWKYGLNDDRFGEKFKEGEMQWAVKNPGFVHELFNDDTSHAIIHYLYVTIPEVIEAYEALPSIVLKMDFFRYLLLLARGGIYADVDTLPLQPVPNWIPENVSPNEIGMIIGIESDPDTPDWRKTYARRLQFCQWVIQAKPGHPILREVVAKITEITLQKKNNEELVVDNNLDILEWTGAGIWTDVVFTYFNDYVQSGIFSKITWKDFTKLTVPKLMSDILVLPITSFSPGIGTMGAQDEDHPLAYVKHYFENIWKNS
ncbi:HOC1 [Cyberlindnera jadinii]|uniref:HOC1 protein n=1 Tax=Cyberlindnera jadinii (strain ATCC 18201 / CBS 1600 / BCRC 20928 / JCM 3617 / NBRC 0987 / NRRL Y-1542) TaxID=983966 RepID=A0A0H5BYN5_CYBJN|nr:mannosyltransferase [Cyberlindnera jadinii NRRL Y-1542]ODV75895.1 mannosyltransferase [Cyberlindnera jadinii NRRL Y-1542]CEP20598.1 HOC1 [Cyberlindnera jadinii]